MIAEKTKTENTYRVLETYLRQLAADGYAHTTCMNRKYILEQFVGRLTTSLEELDISFVDDHIVERSKRLTRESINLEKQILRSFFEFCQRRRHIPMKFSFDVIRKRRVPPKKTRVYTPAEVTEVVRKCGNRQDALMIATLWDTGMRISDLVNLRSDDMRDTEFRVRGKGEKDRLVYCTENLARALRLHVANRQDYSPYVFVPLQQHHNHSGDKYTTGRARERIQRQFERAGYEGMYPHQLRHSFAVNWLLLGGDIRSLQKLMGHSSLDVTQRYLQLTDNQMQQIYHDCVKESVIK